MAYAPRIRGELGKTGPQLFLSHSSKDKPIVTRLAQNLNSCGVDVWFDTWELRVGADLHESIAEAVQKSRFVAVVVGQHFQNSKWIKGEVHQALSREKVEDQVVVLPLLIKDVALPPVLTGKFYLELTDELYFPSLVRLAGLIHNLPTESLEQGIARTQPSDVAGCIEVLRYCNFNPYCVVGSQILDEIASLRGTRNDQRVQFDPYEVRSHSKASPAVRDLMDRLIEEWQA